MPSIVANDLIRLTINVPELALVIGQIGRVVSSWLYPNAAYEVEFAPQPALCARRVMQMAHQLELAGRHHRHDSFPLSRGDGGCIPNRRSS
jgi:hypothetical protein